MFECDLPSPVQVTQTEEQVCPLPGSPPGSQADVGEQLIAVQQSGTFGTFTISWICLQFEGDQSNPYPLSSVSSMLKTRLTYLWTLPCTHSNDSINKSEGKYQWENVSVNIFHLFLGQHPMVALLNLYS